jgi:hypothetical protein
MTAKEFYVDALGSQELIIFILQAAIILLPIIVVILILSSFRNFKRSLSRDIMETNTQLGEIRQLLEENLALQRKGD